MKIRKFFDFKKSFFVVNRKMLVIEKKSVLFYEFLLFYGNCLLLVGEKNDVLD